MHGLSYIKEIKADSVIFIVDVGEVEIEVDAMTKDTVEEILKTNDEALITLNAKHGKVLVDS